MIKFPFQKSGMWRRLQLLKKRKHNLGNLGTFWLKRPRVKSDVVRPLSFIFFSICGFKYFCKSFWFLEFERFHKRRVRSLTHTPIYYKNNMKTVTLKSIVNPDGTKKNAPRASLKSVLKFELDTHGKFSFIFRKERTLRLKDVSISKRNRKRSPFCLWSLELR